MANPTNTLTGFFPTLIAAAGDFSKTLAPSNKVLQATYRDISLVPAGIGNTINVNIPAARTATDVGAGDNTFSNATLSTTAITLSHKAQDGMVIRGLEQWTSPQQLKEVLLDSMVKAVHNQIGSTVAALCNTTNFNVNGTVTQAGTTPHLIDTADFLSARAILASQYVPVEDSENMFFITHSDVYHQMLNDNNWIQAYQIGSQLAGDIRSSGVFKKAFSTEIAYDQNFTKTGSASNYVYSSVLLHKYAICLVSRPLPPPDNAAIQWFDFPVDGLPFRVAMTYDLVADGWRIVVSCGYGVSVTRPNMGIILKTNAST